MSDDTNILTGDWRESDKEAFFGPLEATDTFIEVPSDTPMCVVLRDTGFFTSSSQARKAGWEGPLPRGWTTLTIGKKRRRLCILNP